MNVRILTLVLPLLLTTACDRTSSYRSAAPAEVKVNPENFDGCKRECLKHTANCFGLTTTLYQQDFANLYAQSKAIAGEGVVNITGSNLFGGFMGMTMKPTMGVPVDKADSGDLKLNVRIGDTSPTLSFQDAGMNNEYGGKIVAIQFNDGLPIFTLEKNNRCLGFFKN